MALSIFDDKTTIPDEVSVTKVLGKNEKFWYELIEFVYRKYPEAIQEWKYPGKN